uniref:Arylsulfatase K n=2 Tax=Pogona vitticeps TaxID=103695 RepID=A0A6J0TMY3_9SAUR
MGRNLAAAAAGKCLKVVAWALLLLPGFAAGRASPPLLCPHEGCGKSNVVMVMCDSFDGRLTFNPENETVALPFISLMKRHGSLFLNAYTNSPICCPSRAAMWSGLFTHLTESWNNFKGLEPNYTTWMDLMEKEGYYTKKYGKLDYTSGHHSLSNRMEAWTRNVDFLLQQEGRPVAALIGNKTSVKVMQKDWETTNEAAAWIRKKATNLTQPFVLYLGLNLPHPYPSPSSGENYGSSTFLTSPYWLQKVTYNAIKIPKWFPFSEMHPIDYYSSYTKNCTGPFTEKEIRDIRAHYYAMCAETDAMLGEIISALNETGLLKSSLIIFTADHGELAMEHRQFYKMSMYEASSHVPLLIMGPNIKLQNISNVVSLVDIYPTMLDIAGIPIPKNLSGYSLMPLILEKAEDTIPSRELHAPWILSEFHGCNVNASTYMLRIDQWKYIAYADGHSVSPQLFDLSADPDELTNIATKFPEITESLNKILYSIIDYPKVSALVEQYNKQEFINWKQDVGQNYSDTLANLRWHQDWKKHPKMYEHAIDQWIIGKTHV